MFNHIQTELKDMVSEDTDTGRIYKTPEGIDLPSITTVLSILSRESIAKWRARVGEEEANKMLDRAIFKACIPCQSRHLMISIRIVMM